MKHSKSKVSANVISSKACTRQIHILEVKQGNWPWSRGWWVWCEKWDEGALNPTSFIYSEPSISEFTSCHFCQLTFGIGSPVRHDQATSNFVSFVKSPLTLDRRYFLSLLFKRDHRLYMVSFVQFPLILDRCAPYFNKSPYNFGFLSPLFSFIMQKVIFVKSNIRCYLIEYLLVSWIATVIS